MASFKKKLEYKLKHSPFFSKIFRFSLSLFLRFVGLFVPMNKRAILFTAHNKKYNDSPKAIYEAIINDNRFNDFSFFWAVNENEKDLIPGKPSIVKPDSFSYFIRALKCKYWVASVNIERSLRFKKKKCRYLNTWHGIPLKTVGNKASGRKDFDFSYINFFCISGEYERSIYKESFNVSDSQLIKTGLPRNDTLYNVNDSEVIDIKKRINLPLNKRIILYAPTWRDSLNGGKSYEIKPPIVFENWRKRLSNDWIVIVRCHPYTTNLLGITFDDFAFDFSNYPDINDLLKVADVLISDYSATIFDYSILCKPIVCFGYDLEDYSKERGFELDIGKEMPGGVCYSEKEVLDRICSMDFASECEATRLFKNKYLEYGGDATKECISLLFNDLL